MGRDNRTALLKRQYEIRGAEVFFDTDLHIKDDILKSVRQQASPKMRAIVEAYREGRTG